MKYKVITTFKPGDWDRYTHRMVVSVLEKWPDVNITVYYEGECPDYKNPNIEYVEINNANKELQNFRIRSAKIAIFMDEIKKIFIKNF